MSKLNYPRFDLSGKVALVTGAARGLGRFLALALAEAGADVALGLRDRAEDGGLAAEITALGRRALALQMDVTQPAQSEAAVAEIVSQWGRLDILVNNAGLGGGSRAEEVTEEEFDRLMSVNLRGAFFAAQAAAKVMRPQKSGRIINISSQAAFIALPESAVYCMTKAALSHLTKCLAVEWGPDNITVNAVAPTWVYTPGTAERLDIPEFKAEVLTHIPLGKVGDPMDVAAAVIYLASPFAGMVTGTSLLVDGGWTAH